jgi:hypothetical protein
MRQHEAFGDVLDRVMGQSIPEPVARVSEAWERPQAVAPNPFLFTTYAVPTFARVAPAASPAADLRFRSIAAPTAAPVPSPEPLRPLRTLAPREQRALRQLIALGADLRPDFDAVELRRAFRILARRYHPDRHPDSTEEVKAGLSRTFAELAENHRCLLAVLESVGPIRH